MHKMRESARFWWTARGGCVIIFSKFASAPAGAVPDIAPRPQTRRRPSAAAAHCAIIPAGPGAFSPGPSFEAGCVHEKAAALRAHMPARALSAPLRLRHGGGRRARRRQGQERRRARALGPAQPQHGRAGSIHRHRLRRGPGGRADGRLRHEHARGSKQLCGQLRPGCGRPGGERVHNRGRHLLEQQPRPGFEPANPLHGALRLLRRRAGLRRNPRGGGARGPRGPAAPLRLGRGRRGRGRVRPGLPGQLRPHGGRGVYPDPAGRRRGRHRHARRHLPPHRLRGLQRAAHPARRAD